MKDFGTPNHPLRASSLPMLMRCSWQNVMTAMKLFEGTVGAAADTGSAVHKAIEVYHTAGKSFDECLAEAFAQGNLSLYPKADRSEAELHFRGYHSDSRNKGTAILATEKQFTITLTEEETEVSFQGTFDQIRLESGLKILYDIKTGKSLPAYDLLMQQTLQLALYWIGARNIGFDVDAVGIIYTYGYRRRTAIGASPMGVFLRHPMRFRDAEELLRPVFRRVKAIRSGAIDIIAGPHCSLCSAQSVSKCIPLHRERYGSCQTKPQCNP